MATQQAALARRVLDRRLRGLGGENEEATARPGGGWIRAVREALGMSTAQLGRRLGVTRQAVLSLERSELDDGIRISSLRRAAEAMDCHLVYAFVPHTSLEESVQQQAMRVAAAELRRVDQTMLLEAQRVDDNEASQQLRERATALVGNRRLWDGDR
jgi:predicted DNA-binding mobile mystery protein A